MSQFNTTCQTPSIFVSEDEAPPPLPPSRSASIRPETSPASNLPPRIRPRPHPRPPVDDDDASNSHATSQTDGSSGKVSALRETVFGEKRSGPPPVLQKSTKKANLQDSGSVPSSAHNEVQKSSVKRIAASLDVSKHDVGRNVETDKGKQTVSDKPSLSTQVERHQEEPKSNSQPSQPPTPSIKKTRLRNVNQLSTLNQQTEDGLLRSGEPYEVPKQGSATHHTSSHENVGSTHDGDISHCESSSSVSIGSGVGRMQAQSSLVSSLQASIAKQKLSKKRNFSPLINVGENRAKSSDKPQDSVQMHSSEGKEVTNELPPLVSSSNESNLLERIRKRKAERISKNTPSDESAIAITSDSNSKAQRPEHHTLLNSSQHAEENVHITKSPLPDPPVGDSPRDGHRSLLRRSSSSLSKRSNNDDVTGTSLGDSSRQSGHKKLHRSPSSVSQKSNDDTNPKPTDSFDNHTNSRRKALHRSPSNASRRSSDERVPYLPPRSYIQAGANRQHDPDESTNSQITTDQSQWGQDQASNTFSKPRRQSTGKNLLVRPQIGSEPATSIHDSKSSEESMLLADFISRYSGALPLAVAIQEAASVSSKQLIATRPCNNFNVHFIKHSRVVIIHDCLGGECFSVPLNSSVRFGLIYNQRSEDTNGSYFETAGDIMSLKQLPYVICATKYFDGGSHEKSVEAGEILFVRGVKKPKTIGRGKVLKVNSIDDNEKMLTSKCSAGFTTAPKECQLNLCTLMAHSIPFPQQAMMFTDTEITSYLPQSMINYPVTLEKIQGESSVIMTPRFDTMAQEDESWTYDVSTEVKLWVRKLPLSENDQQDLNAVTNVHYSSFDPLYLQHYAEKSDTDGIALQHVLCINTLPGKEKEGVHLYLPNANMLQQQMNEMLPDIHADQNMGTTHILSEHERAPVNDSTYAIHITEQNRKSTSGLAGRNERKGTTSVSTQHGERTSYIPPDESSDIEQEDEDGCEEAYEEVMTALEPVHGQTSAESGNIAKLAGMLKSIKHPLKAILKEEKHQPQSTKRNDFIEPASPSPESEEDYDRISFSEDITNEEDRPSQLELPPPLPDTSQIAGRRPPPMAPPPPPPEQGAPVSIALQRLMAAAKITSASVASDTDQKQEEAEQEGYQSFDVDDEMFEDEESGYSDVRSLNIPSIIADKQSSIATALSKRKPPLPTPAKEESPGTNSLKGSGHSPSTSNTDDAEPVVQDVQQSSRHASRCGSVEGDYVRLRELYSGLQTQMAQMMDEMNHMKTHIEKLSNTVEELVQAKDREDSVHPSKTQTLPRKRKVLKNK